MHNSKDFNQIIADFRKKGLRVTEPRRVILQYLMASHRHPTVEEIFNDVSHELEGLSMATIYNNVKFFVEQGIVHEMKFSQEASRYDFMGHQHGHIICTNCGEIADFNMDYDLETVHLSATQQTSYIVEGSKLEVYGLCPKCQSLPID